MSRRVIAAIACMWTLSLVGVAVWAQTPAPNTQEGQPVGGVITGEEFGFQRLAAPPNRDGRIVGRWMVKIDGKWRETQAPVGITR